MRPRPNTNVGPSPFTNGPAGTIGTVSVVGYVVDTRKPCKAALVEDTKNNGMPDAEDKKIGNIKIKGLRSARGEILPSYALTTSGDGVSGTNGSVLNVPVQVGDETGVYRIFAQGKSFVGTSH